MPNSTPGQGPSRTIYFSKSDADYLEQLINSLDNQLQEQGSYDETTLSGLLRAIITAYRLRPVSLLPIIRATQQNVNRHPWKYVPNPNPKGGQKPPRTGDRA